MSAQAASIDSLLSILLLADHRVLELSWSTPFNEPLEWSNWREPVYLAYQPWAARYPDHVFSSAWRFLSERQPAHGALLTALSALAIEFVELRHGVTRIRRDLFGAWQQGLASRLSTLPIQAAAKVSLGSPLLSLTPTSFTEEESSNKRTAAWRRQVVPLLHPEEAPVADYITREGLHESHLHLNGSTHSEICWLRALRNIRAETREFVTTWKHEKGVLSVRDLIGQINPRLTPQVFHQHLLAANRLRTWLVGAATGQIGAGAQLPFSCESMCAAGEDDWSEGLALPMPSWRSEPDIQDELSWMEALIGQLMQQPSTQISRMFHTYLLLLNQYFRLLVQSETQYGFDQFQKLTLTKLRDPSERDFRTRFNSMHGLNSTISTIGYLEGRFSPKVDLRKAEHLYQAVLGGYHGYLRDTTGASELSSTTPRSLSRLLTELDSFFARQALPHRRIHRLTLVAHFIKRDWSPKANGKAGPFRHYPLDVDLRHTVNVLLLSLDRWPRLRTWVRGIDAAANELHAPPDVFAPAFRVCYRAGLSRRSYHAGEDFRHLLSGIATMWEALEFLQLRDGDRIGHGTAMGIRPSLWLDRMPRKISLPRGEWFQGVLAAWQLLRDEPEMQGCANRLQRELEGVAHEIFGRTLSALDIERAMALRGLSRLDVMRQLTSCGAFHHETLNDLWREETEQVKVAYHNQRSALELLWEWLSHEAVLIRAHELVAKEAQFLAPTDYLRLQQALMCQVASRGVLIETLPSSNVRISQYHHIGEHHSLRWMRVPGFVEHGDPEIMVCLGSDDPGIFANDLETEFYLMYATLRQAGLSDSDALNRLSTLNERGRTYRFHHPLLS
ncbi:hypothetical protein [Pseudomonas aeruginosa]|uniref:hypothetical protein n=1 Tax=Pseudomonas aeruginosa TaxID=287 RepID=UPI000EB44435|nr:hypothetical protein [Pseudomonas aeruginosa]